LFPPFPVPTQARRVVSMGIFAGWPGVLLPLSLSMFLHPSSGNKRVFGGQSSFKFGSRCPRLPASPPFFVFSPLFHAVDFQALLKFLPDFAAHQRSTFSPLPYSLSRSDDMNWILLTPKETTPFFRRSELPLCRSGRSRSPLNQSTALKLHSISRAVRVLSRFYAPPSRDPPLRTLDLPTCATLTLMSAYIMLICLSTANFRNA